jgi:hypothetical protein
MVDGQKRRLFVPASALEIPIQLTEKPTTDTGPAVNESVPLSDNVSLLGLRQ